MADEQMDPETGELRELALGLVQGLPKTQLDAPSFTAPKPPDRSEQLHELAKALAAAQGEMENASKDSSNPHYQSRYSSLASCWDACRGPLSKNGLAIVQRVVESNAKAVGIETLLVHSSGQWISQTVRMPMGERATAQAVGSCVSYGRRYGLCCMVGIASEDDDGEAASKSAAPTRDSGTYVRPPTAQRKALDPRLSEDQHRKAAELFKSST